MGRNFILSKGLGRMYVGGMIAAISSFLVFIPVINTLAIFSALIGALMIIFGLLSVRKIHDYYMKAVVVVFVGMLAGMFISVEWAADFVNAATALARAYCIIMATNDLLEKNEHFELVPLGNQALKLEIIVGGVRMVCAILSSVISIVSVIGVLASITGAVFSLVFYLRYLNLSSKVFG